MVRSLKVATPLTAATVVVPPRVTPPGPPARVRVTFEVSRVARVSLGYLSEIEQCRKEPSSELLASICDALDLPLDELLRRVADDLGPVYLPEVPDTLAAELVAA